MRLKRIQTGPSCRATRSTADSYLYSIINKFRGEDPDWSLVAEDWPTFLYDEQAGWNGKDIRKGLFRGHVLARVSLIDSTTIHTRPPTSNICAGCAPSFPQQDCCQG